MGGLKPLGLGVAAIAAAAGALSPARGQCRLCSTPTTAPSDAADSNGIELEIETSLNFDRLIVSGAGQGAAVLRPDGTAVAQGTLTEVSPRAMVGTVIVHGEAGRGIRVELPIRAELYSLSGGRITVDDLVSDLPSAPKLDSAGNLTFRFGGRVTVTGDSEGEYRGDLPITVEYQ